MGAVFFDAGNTLLYLDLGWIAERLRADGWEIEEEGLYYGQSVAAYEASRLALLKKYPKDSDRLVPYFRRVLELAGIPRDFTAEYAGVLIEEHLANILWRTVPEHVRETLEELVRRGYILGVISNTDGRLKSLLDNQNLSSYFTCIIDSTVVGVEKPSVEIFTSALDAAETDAERCVYVGDIYAIDILGAERAGMKGVLLDPLALHEDFDCTRIKRLRDILELLPPIDRPPMSIPG